MRKETVLLAGKQAEKNRQRGHVRLSRGFCEQFGGTLAEYADFVGVDLTELQRWHKRFGKEEKR